jgi:hypothetical protein
MKRLFGRISLRGLNIRRAPSDPFPLALVYLGAIGLIADMIVTSFWCGRFWGTVLIAVLAPLTILGSVLNPSGFFATALEWSPLRFIGRDLLQPLPVASNFFYCLLPRRVPSESPGANVASSSYFR